MFTSKNCPRNHLFFHGLIFSCPSCYSYSDIVYFNDYSLFYFALSLQEVASQFVDGKTPLDSFLESYAQIRKMAHLRRINSEKMAELLQEKEQRGRRSSQQNNFSPGSQSFVNSTPTNLPYPVNAHMPLPDTTWY